MWGFGKTSLVLPIIIPCTCICTLPSTERIPFSEVKGTLFLADTVLHAPYYNTSIPNSASEVSDAKINVAENHGSSFGYILFRKWMWWTPNRSSYLMIR